MTSRNRSFHEWSPDGSVLALRTGGQQSPLRLYLKDMLSPSEPIRLASTVCTGFCQIHSATFQPHPAD